MYLSPGFPSENIPTRILTLLQSGTFCHLEDPSCCPFIATPTSSRSPGSDPDAGQPLR